MSETAGSEIADGNDGHKVLLISKALRGVWHGVRACDVGTGGSGPEARFCAGPACVLVGLSRLEPRVY